MALDKTRLEQLPPLIPREVLFGNPEKAAPKISPDGGKIAYLAPKDGVLNVWTRTRGQDDDQPVTDDRKRGIRQFFWQADSAHVLYMQDRDGDENFHLYQTDLATKQTQDLTPFAGARALPVAADPNFPDTLLVSVNQRDPRLFDVYRLDLPTRALTLDTENPGDVAGWTADNDLQIRACQVQTADGGTELRVRDDADSPWRVFQTWGPDETGGGIVGFTPDNQQRLTHHSVDANAARLLETDLETGARQSSLKTRRMMSAGRCAIREHMRWKRCGSSAGQPGMAVLRPRLCRPTLPLLRAVRDGEWNIASRDLADKPGSWHTAPMTGRIYYYVYDRDDAESDPAVQQPARLWNTIRLAKMQPVAFPARDGMTLHGYLTLPAGFEPKNLPLVLLVHGGPWARDVWGYSPDGAVAGEPGLCRPADQLPRLHRLRQGVSQCGRPRVGREDAHGPAGRQSLGRRAGLCRPARKWPSWAARMAAMRPWRRWRSRRKSSSAAWTSSARPT